MPEQSIPPFVVASEAADAPLPVADLADLHREAASHFCAYATRLTELWQESVAGRSAASPGLLESCLRLQLSDELEQLERFCRSLVAREESALRIAGMRRFRRAWRDHKRSHARLLRRIERRALHCSTEPPGELARNVAILLEDYWAAHFTEHDQLALSLIALLREEDPNNRASGRRPSFGSLPTRSD